MTGFQAEAAGQVARGDIIPGYEAVRVKKAQPKLTGGSWTSLQQVQVLVPAADADKAQQAIKRAAAMAKGNIVARSASLVPGTSNGMCAALLLHRICIFSEGLQPFVTAVIAKLLSCLRKDCLQSA